MGLRETLNEHRAITIPVLAALLALAGFWAFHMLSAAGGPARASTEIWFYDLGTGKPFAAKPAEPPIKAPSGQDGVIAHVFACGDCSDAGARFVAYIETNNPDAQRPIAGAAATGQPGDVRRKPGGIRRDAMLAARLVATPDQKPAWVAAASPEGQALVREAVHCPDGRLPTRCSP